MKTHLTNPKTNKTLVLDHNIEQTVFDSIFNDSKELFYNKQEEIEEIYGVSFDLCDLKIDGELLYGYFINDLTSDEILEEIFNDLNKFIIDNIGEVIN
jgi:hypothetical protein